MRLNKSVKIGKNLYRVPRPKKSMKINANEAFCVVEHKGRWVVAITSGWDREFVGNQKLNRTEALQLISFLSYYVNLVKPTDATALHASIKVSTNRITRSAHELVGVAVGKEFRSNE